MTKSLNAKFVSKYMLVLPLYLVAALLMTSLLQTTDKTQKVTKFSTTDNMQPTHALHSFHTHPRPNYFRRGARFP